MYEYTYKITPDDGGQQKTITIMDKKGYDFDVNSKIRAMVELYWNGHATWERVSKKEVEK